MLTVINEGEFQEELKRAVSNYFLHTADIYMAEEKIKKVTVNNGVLEVVYYGKEETKPRTGEVLSQ